MKSELPKSNDDLETPIAEQVLPWQQIRSCRYFRAKQVSDYLHGLEINEVHYDGAKDEDTILLIVGIGPATATPADAK
jgi:hypothetical protein